MKANYSLGMLGALIASFAIGAPASFAQAGPTTPTPSVDRHAVMEAYGKQPLSFEPNTGQTDPQVKFLSRGPGYVLFLTGKEAVLSMQEQPAANSTRPAPMEALERELHEKAKSTVLRMALVGAEPNPQLVGLEELPGKANYLTGNDQSKWRTELPSFAKVKYEGVYPGVDLVYYGNQRQLEYDFVIAPGADPSRIRLSFEGARLRVDNSTGDLLITTKNGSEVRHARPRVYQQVGSQQVEVAGSYQILDGKQAAFKLAAYDRRQPLVIDPTVSFTTFLSGNSQDAANAVAVDGAGNAYLTGYTLSTNFPVVDEIFATSQGGYDAFVTKLSSAGAILFSTYWGGNGIDAGTGIAVDSTGVFICGYTSSTNFPGQLIGSASSGLHAFVTKFSLTGQEIYSVKLAGSIYDEANAIAIDSSHAAYITGITYSTDFPIVGTWQTTNHGGYDAFVAKLNSNGELVNSAYIGGSSSDWGNGIAVDANHWVYITGQTWSSDFPHTMPVTLIAGGNVFVASINNTFTGFVYSTEFGGGSCSGTAIALAGEDAYVTGNVAFNTYFPTTFGAFQTSRPSLAGDSAFVTALDSYGGITYSTYLGGPNGSTDATAIAVFGNGVYVSGRTSSSNFPGAQVLTPNPTAGWVTKLTPQLNAQDYATLLGATINGIAVYQPPSAFVNAARYVYTVGMRYTGGLATQDQDAFAVKLYEPASIPIIGTVPVAQ